MNWCFAETQKIKTKKWINWFTKDEEVTLASFLSTNIDFVDATETPEPKESLNLRGDYLSVEWRRITVPIESYRIHQRLETRPSGNAQAFGINISNIQFTGTVNNTAMSNLGSSKREVNEVDNENMDTPWLVCI